MFSAFVDGMRDAIGPVSGRENSAMITSAKTAREFAQSIAIRAVDVQNAIDGRNWEAATDALVDIQSDYERLQQYVDARIEQIAENK